MAILVSPEYMMHLPAGTTVHASCTYDNTSNNPNNPSDPPQWTFWGDDTNDEMFFVPFRYVIYEEGDENIFLGDDAVLLGDLNNDGSINVLDVVALTNCVLEANCFQEEGYVNSDGTFNVLDIVSLVGWILG